MERILQPFMAAQQALEGEKYVSNSLIPHVLQLIQSKLVAIEENTEDEGVKGLVDKLLRDRTNGFNNNCGSGENGTVLKENETLGYRHSCHENFENRSLDAPPGLDCSVGPSGLAAGPTN